MKGKNKEKSPVRLGSIMIRAAAVLLCLTLFSFRLTSGLYARYITNDDASDSARVASFDVKVTGPEGADCIVSAMSPGKITLTVKNDSEVAVAYSFRIQINEAAGCGVLAILDNDPGKSLAFPAHTSSVLGYADVGSLDPAAAIVTHTISFEPLDWALITSLVTGESKNLSQAFTVYVDIVQID